MRVTFAGELPCRVELSGFPDLAKQALLQAIFLSDDAECQSAFSTWERREQLENVDYASRRVLPLLRLRWDEARLSRRIVRAVCGLERLYWCAGQLLAREVGEALRALATANLPCLALKGAAMLPLYGGNMGLRPMADVDLLVSQERAQEVVTLLVRRGWRLASGCRMEEVEEQYGRLHSWALRKGHAEIDVHWRSLLEDLSPRADEGLWARATAGEIFGAPVLLPSPTDLLMHICVHGVRFSWTRSVTWVADACLLLGAGTGLLTRNRVMLEGADIDWALLESEATRRFLHIPVRETLRFLRQRLGAEVPERTLAALAVPPPAELFWCDFRAHSAPPNASSSLHRMASHLVARLCRGEQLPPGMIARFQAMREVGA